MIKLRKHYNEQRTKYEYNYNNENWCYVQIIFNYINNIKQWQSPWKRYSC